MIYHMLQRMEWESVPQGGALAPASLAREGFIHFSDSADQLMRVANSVYRDEPGEWLVLCVDESRLASPTRWEANPVERFPHVYGPVTREAVVAVVDFPRAADGQFLLPEQFAGTIAH